MQRKLLTLLFFFILPCVSYAQERKPMEPFEYQIQTIPTAIAAGMRQHTWREECPVGLEELAYVTLAYWDFDNERHLGHLVVHQKVAKEVVAIFHDIYAAKFSIASMRLMDDFQGNDAASMSANNSSAFNCRRKTEKHWEFSVHSYGLAIDINPIQNPYVNHGRVFPPEGEAYLDRHEHRLGMIVKGDVVYRAFRKRGWEWGGNWEKLKDYQHFQK